MSDAPSNGGKTALGVQAYRWLVAAGLALLTLLSQRTLAGIDDTAKAVNDLRAVVQSMQGTTNTHAHRLDSIDRRNDQQDTKIDAIQLKVWGMPGGRP
jgi:hypothetical protein